MRSNPGIVSLSLPGFASVDPEFAGLPSWEALIAARAGQFTDMGLNRRLMGIRSSFTPLGLASAFRGKHRSHEVAEGNASGSSSGT